MHTYIISLTKSSSKNYFVNIYFLKKRMKKCCIHIENCTSLLTFPNLIYKFINIRKQKEAEKGKFFEIYLLI